MIISDLEYQQEVADADAHVKGGLVKLVIGKGKFGLVGNPIFVPPGTGPLGIINTPLIAIPPWAVGWGVL
jgi:hypothetical protein